MDKKSFEPANLIPRTSLMATQLRVEMTPKWPQNDLKMTLWGQNIFKLIISRKNGVEKYINRRVYVGHQILPRLTAWLSGLTAVQNDLSRSKYTQNRNLHKKRNRTVCLSICSGWSSDLTALNRVVTRSNRGWKPPGWKEHRWFYRIKFLVVDSTTSWCCFIGVWNH